MKVLVACEESQAVCKAFREKGHEAYSCDIIDCSGGHPEWHIKSDVSLLLNGYCFFDTADGKEHFLNSKWDMILAFPPCTHLAVKGLQPLEPTNIVDRGEFITHKSGKVKPKWFADAFSLPPEERAKVRSKTFPGIAKAMAEQWGIDQ